MFVKGFLIRLYMNILYSVLINNVLDLILLSYSFGICMMSKFINIIFFSLEGKFIFLLKYIFIYFCIFYFKKIKIVCYL